MAKVKSDEPSSYESAMTELEKLITDMENGQLPLEASLIAYQRGTLLIKYCQKMLEKVDQQIKVLEEDGQLHPFSQNELSAK